MSDEKKDSSEDAKESKEDDAKTSKEETVESASADQKQQAPAESKDELKVDQESGSAEEKKEEKVADQPNKTVKEETENAVEEKLAEVKAEEAAEDKEESKEAKTEADSESEAAAKPEPEPEPEEQIDHTLAGLIGRKLGMTQIFDRDGNAIPVTAVEAGPCTVLEVHDSPVKVKIGFDSIKESRTTKARAGYFKKLKLEPFRITKEFRSADNPPYKVGQKVRADVFKAGDYVDVTGTSIGKGFSGGMKRHGWGGGPGGHGSMHHRRVGSIGASAYPAKVVKGFPMPGQLGNKQVTTQGLRVMDIDVDNNVILLKGSIPGSKNGIIAINRSRKKEWKDLNEVKAVVQHKVNPMKQSKGKAKAAKKKGK